MAVKPQFLTPLTSLITPFCLIGRFPLQKMLSLNQTTMAKVSKHLHSSTSASTTTTTTTTAATTNNNIRVYKRRVVAQQKKKDDLIQSQTGEDYESMTLQQLRTIPNISGGQNPDTPDPVSEVTRTEPKKRRRKPTVVDGGNALEGNSSNPVVAKSVSITKKVMEKRKTSLVKKEEDAKVIGNSDEPWTILAHKKPQEGWVPYNPKLMRPPPLASGNCVKLISWNVNGIRALQKTDGFAELAKRDDFDILCLQETKLQEKNVEELKESFLDGYEHSFWTCSVSKLGYSGSAIISRIKPVSVRYGLGILDHDTEGRIVTVEFDSFYLISGYAPNSGDGLKRLEYRITQWDAALANYLKELEKSKPVILTGDLNCAHQEIDIFSPATNRRSAGFTNEERESFEKNFLSRGFVDTFRKQHPGVVAYTFWGYRQVTARITNKGWRLDYFLVSESIANKVHDSYILSDVAGSDHCPIGLILKL